MADSLNELKVLLAQSNRILSHEGVLDAFGHVSFRHPDRPDRYFLSRSRSPALVEPADIIEYDLDSQPVKPVTVNQYAERVIHGEIYQARPDVMAVCHHHAPAVLPFCIAGKKIVPVFHIGAVIGTDTPFWDQRDEFGDTNLLVKTPDEGRSLARALGDHSVVLMRRHGATVIGADMKELTSRSIFLCWNAKYQLQAQLLGDAPALPDGEIALAGKVNTMPIVVTRIWEYWSTRLTAAGGWPPPRASRAAAGSSSRKAAGTARVKAASKAKSKRPGNNKKRR